MLKKNSITRGLCLILAFITIWGIKKVEADSFEKVEITFSSESPFKIINDEGETIIVDEEGQVSGTMDILKDEIKRSVPNIYHSLIVRKSNSYVVEQEREGDNYLSIDYLEDNSNLIVLSTKDTKMVFV